MPFFRLFAAGLFAAGAALGAFGPANRPYDVTHYKLKMELNPAQAVDEFSAQVEIRLKATAPLDEITFDAEQLTVNQVRLIKPAKKSLEFRVNEGKRLDITLPGKLKPGTEWVFLIDYKGAINTSNNGLFKVSDTDEPNRGPLLFTFDEPRYARTVFPCNDEPYDKATTEVEITTPAKNSVISNGLLASDKKFKRDGAMWHTVHWSLDRPQSTYLVSVAVGEFAKISTKVRDKEISLWVGKTKTEQAKYSLDVTKQALEFYESYLNVPYPWPKYAIVGLPTFLWGGMENTSATIQNEERTLLADPKSSFEKKYIVGLDAHELAHQWFGDDVTLQWWDDVWLNESFASHMASLASKQILKSDQPEIELVTDTWDSYFTEEDGPRSHPIVDKQLSSAEDAFDSINYTKGENVLRMLSFYVGEDKFRHGLQAYLVNHAYANATNKDFFENMEKASLEDLSQFRNSWILTRGYPVVTYGGSWDSDASLYRLKLSQRSNHPEDSTVFRFRIPVTFQRKAAPAYSKTITVDMGKDNSASDEVATSLPATPEWVTVNPGSVVLARVQQNERDEGLLAAQALGDSDSIARVWAGYELAHGLVAGDSISSFAEKTLCEMLKQDPSPYVRIALLSAFQKMKSRWLPSQLSDTVFELAKTATAKGFETSPAYLADEFGMSEWRSELLGTLGKIDRDQMLPFLAGILAKRDLPLDDLGKAAVSVAQLGNDKSPTLIKDAIKLHKERGYRYQYALEYALGAYESPKAAAEIKEQAKTCSSDLIGRWTWLIKHNQTLIHSPEWAQFVADFALHNLKFGDEVKARLLETIEDVKTADVKAAMESIVKNSTSDRIREDARRILDRNFPASKT